MYKVFLYAMFGGFMAVVWCGSAGNNSKVVRCNNAGVVIRKVISDDRLICGVVDRDRGVRI